jgi:hypothetical protein
MAESAVHINDQFKERYQQGCKAKKSHYFFYTILIFVIRDVRSHSKNIILGMFLSLWILKGYIKIEEVPNITETIELFSSYLVYTMIHQRGLNLR